MGIRVLPNFEGYTVDLRLQQFRKCLLDELPEFIEFDSDEGKELLDKFQASCPHAKKEYYDGALGYEAMVCTRCGKHFV